MTIFYNRIVIIFLATILIGCISGEDAESIADQISTATNSAPVMTTISTKTINEDDQLSATFTILDADNATVGCNATTLSFASTDSTIIDPADVNISGSNSSCTISVQPKAHANGTVAVTINATDGSKTASIAFAVNILPVTDVQDLSLTPYNNASGTHSCAVINSTAKCWGANTSGQLGDGTNVDRNTMVDVVGFENVSSQVATNYRNTCVLKTDATVWCFGHGFYGQLGNGTIVANRTPQQVIKDSDDNPLTNIVEIAAGYLTTCARDISGLIWCWGYNATGAVGDGTNTQRTKAVNVLRDTGAGSTTLTNATALLGRGYHFCTIRNDKTLWCWGRNTFSVLGDGTSTNRNIAVQAMKNDGGGDTVITDAEKIGGGFYHNCYIDSSQKVWCWGNGANGRIGDGGTTHRTTARKVLKSDNSDLTATALTGGLAHTCAVGTDTKAYCWGQGYSGELGINDYPENVTQATAVKDPTNTANDMTGFTGIAAGYRTTCAINNDKIYCWGSNNRGAHGASSVTMNSLIPTKTNLITNVKALADGSTFDESAHYCAIINDGNDTATCWGANFSGQLGNNTKTTTGTPTKVLNEAGTGNLENITSISTGGYSTCAVASGQVYCWGEGRYSAIGNGSSSDQVLPVKVVKSDDSNLDNAVEVQVGAFHACARDNANQVWCWGSNTYGALGNNTTVTSNKAVSVLRDDLSGGTTDFNTAASISVGDRYTCAIDSSNQGWCWGYNGVGVLGDNSTTSRQYAVKIQKDDGGVTDFNNIASLSTGFYNTCAVDTAAKLWCWGNGTYNKTGSGTQATRTVAGAVLKTDDTELTNITKVDISHFAVCAADTSNQLFCWGRNYTSVMPNPTAKNYSSAKAIESRDPINTGINWADVSTFNLTTHGGCALTTSNEVYCWGENVVGHYGNGTMSSSSIPIVASFWD